ncbi:MAG: hypothetical protein M1840_002810 [Geoglossum simile]|nr:MAG: hypothetical protein M1840_002810 [Geoglossum simile]
MENASGAARFGDSVRASFRRLVRRPGAFFWSKPFGLVYLLYSTTYLTANTLDTLSATLHSSPPSTVTSGAPKFFLTSAANMTLCLVKDRTFARLFATIPPTPIPLATYTLFGLRDSLTIFASFNLPPAVAPHLPLSSASKRADLAQFLCPAAVQVVSTPLHLWGLDLYNRKACVGWKGRAVKVMGDWGVSFLARVVRILPAFGVGGVVNMRVRKGLMEGLEGGVGEEE